MGQSKKYLEHMEQNVIHPSINPSFPAVSVGLGVVISAAFGLHQVRDPEMVLFGLWKEAGENSCGRTFHLEKPLDPGTFLLWANHDTTTLETPPAQTVHPTRGLISDVE